MKLEKEFKEKYVEVLSIQGQNGNYNFDRYMLGLYNGMEMIIAMYENREPNYKDAHEITFLNDKQDILQQRIDKVIDLIINHHNDLIIISDDGRRVEICFKKIISILQDEEAK